jgi:hypothetical protein
MRLPAGAHTVRPWRIHALTPDFRLEDVWALPTPGGADDFPRLVAVLASRETGRDAPRTVRALFAIRWAIGRLLRWDDRPAGGDRDAPSLCERLPADLRAAPAPAPGPAAFTPLYELPDEWAGELVNRTMHGVLHLGWVTDGAGAYRGQMAVLVRPEGRLGAVYMAAIRPFRHRVVYPGLLRTIERRWREGAAARR